MKNMTAAILLNLFVSSASYGWGSIGHRIVGEIAQNHITTRTKMRLEKLAGLESLATMANWPDFVRSDDSYKYAEPWHYVSIPDGMTYEESPKNPNGDVVEAIRRMIQQIKNKKISSEERLKAVKFLVHFIGDIHQPLHVGNADDRGGNLTYVLWFNEPTSLHHVWDESLIELQRLSYSEYAKMLDIVDRKTTNKWGQDDVLVWAKESMDWRSNVYDIGDGKLGYQYNFKNIAFLNQRLLQAGIRLAYVLNSNLL